MPKIARVPITNVYMDGDYTGKILVGRAGKPLNVILDTGSSALALDVHKYSVATGDDTTDIAQSDAYGDGTVGWTGAVIETVVAIGDGATKISLANANVAIAYDQTASMFGAADGILGLAYAPLDNAFTMPDNTWKNKYTPQQINQEGTQTTLTPYLSQLAGQDVVSDIISFYTKRSFVHQGTGGESDPLNQGLMIVGGGQESTDLYSGTFQSVKVLDDEWYCTNLKSITVGNTSPIAVRARGPQGMPSNSIIDSGTNTLNLGPQLLRAIMSKFNSAQQAQLAASLDGHIVPAASLSLSSWPDMKVVLEGSTQDVTLTISPQNYWQVDAPKVGAALASFSQGQEGLAILGLPLMNGYFTIFDGEADSGRGTVMFATRKD